MTGHTVVILADMKTTVCPVSKVDHSGLTVHAAAAVIRPRPMQIMMVLLWFIWRGSPIAAAETT